MDAFQWYHGGFFEKMCIAAQMLPGTPTMCYAKASVPRTSYRISYGAIVGGCDSREVQEDLGAVRVLDLHRARPLRPRVRARRGSARLPGQQQVVEEEAVRAAARGVEEAMSVVAAWSMASPGSLSGLDLVALVCPTCPSS